MESRTPPSQEWPGDVLYGAGRRALTPRRHIKNKSALVIGLCIESHTPSIGNTGPRADPLFAIRGDARQTFQFGGSEIR